MGFTALGVETGLWYAIKRQNQTAADMAAISGAFELDAGQGYGLTADTMYPDICAMAKQDAASNGFTFVSFTCPSTTPGCTNPASEPDRSTAEMRTNTQNGLQRANRQSSRVSLRGRPGSDP
jgi:hypothetical protein